MRPRGRPVHGNQRRGSAGHLIGDRSFRPRIDSREKVLGSTRYAADVNVPMNGLLHARLVLSLYAHARSRLVDRSAALAVPGVVAVLTRTTCPSRARRDADVTPLARDHAVLAGQPVAIVVAKPIGRRRRRRRGGGRVEPLPMAVDTELSMVIDATLTGPDRTERPRTASSNPHTRRSAARSPSCRRAVGERRRQALASQGRCRRRSRRIRRCGRGPFRDGLGLPGLHRATGRDGLGRAVGRARRLEHTPRASLYTRTELAKIFGLPVNKVRSGRPLGGGYEDDALNEPLVAGAALAVRRPVQLVITRREDFAMTRTPPGLGLRGPPWGPIGTATDWPQARMVFDRRLFRVDPR